MFICKMNMLLSGLEIYDLLPFKLLTVECELNTSLGGLVVCVSRFMCFSSIICLAPPAPWQQS